ncbi:MAG: type II secretion system protein [Phycisphaerales bacterium]|nr:type II secretion system protein [Phycisphaerales bacterium]
MDHARHITFRGRACRPAMTLLELVVVIATIGVLAAIAVPRASRAFQRAGHAGVMRDWGTLQRQIDLYAMEHMGAYPAQRAAGDAAALTEEAFLAQMLWRTTLGGDASDKAGAGYDFGPYLAVGVPALKAGRHAGEAGVFVIQSSAAPRYMPAQAVGWVYQPLTGEIVPNIPLTEGADGAVVIDENSPDSLGARPGAGGAGRAGMDSLGSG